MPERLRRASRRSAHTGRGSGQASDTHSYARLALPSLLVLSTAAPLREVKSLDERLGQILLECSLFLVCRTGFTRCTACAQRAQSVGRDACELVHISDARTSPQRRALAPA